MGVTIKHYIGRDEVADVENVTREEFEALFPGFAGGDQFALFFPVGRVGGRRVPVQRAVAFRAAKTRHRCDVRCEEATGNDCSCSCGGRNHGAGAFRGVALGNLVCVGG